MSWFKSRIPPFLALIAAVCILAPLAEGAANPNAEPQDTDVDILAKIAKERSKSNAQQALDKAAVGNGTNSDGCGNIGIGNIFTGGRPGFQPPRQVTVIVTGDVISANNKCK